MAQSIAAAVTRKVQRQRVGSFIRVRDLEVNIGVTRHAIEVVMSRLAAADVVQSFGRGLYWKGDLGRGGMQPPSAAALGIEVGGAGSGPCDVSAARFLGLTSQVPVSEHIAVPGRAPAPLPGIEFHSRPHSRATHALRPAEVAVLEVLRIWPSGVEETWRSFCSRVTKLIERGTVRIEVVSAALNDERTPDARRHWHAFRERLTTSR